MAASDFSWTTDHSEHTEKWYCCIGAELLSIEPWNTGTGGGADCEDMPRKFIDIKFSDYPVGINICNFQGSSEPFSLTLFFHKSFDTTMFPSDEENYITCIFLLI